MKLKGINIRADALYQSELERPSFPEQVFIEVMKSAISSVEFSFNNEMYLQKDGVAMGSPLPPALANIIIGVHEHKLLSSIQNRTVPQRVCFGLRTLKVILLASLLYLGF